MTRIELWIVTYNNPPDLHANLNSLFSNLDYPDATVNVTIINNHSHFELDPVFQDRVRVIHNSLRSDNSLGHLARNWNQAIINSVADLNNPGCDLLITSQDDVIWLPGWLEKAVRYSKQYSFITQGHGDAVVIYRPESIRKIGLWDERYTPSFYHDGDYFLRALIHNRMFSSINDPGHGRVWNALEDTLIEVPPQNDARAQAKFTSIGHARFPHLVWMHKWDVSPIHWDPGLLSNPPRYTKCMNFITYPHFELAVDDLAGKNYLF